MKITNKWMVVSIIILFIMIFTSYSWYETHRTLQGTEDNLKIAQISLGISQSALETINGTLENTIKELDDNRSSLNVVKNDLTRTQSELNNKQTELNSTKNDLANTQENLNYAANNLSASNDKLAQLESKYPPKNFPDRRTLVNWMNALYSPYNNWNSRISIAFQRQLLAMKDGYIWNITISPNGYKEMVVAGSVAYIIEIDGSLTNAGEVNIGSSIY
jgi:DNA repair exonuclease SbcCD ATPase subunit